MYGLIFLIIFCIGIILTMIGYNNDTLWNDYEWLIIIGLVLMLFISWLLPVSFYYAYEVPTLNVKAQNYCQSLGYDDFKTWNGEGFFPDELIYIECKYVENSLDAKLNIQGEK